MNNKKLTIVITTYNRKQSLYKQLHSLEIQGLYDKYSVIVSNNCSDYDVDKWLDEKLSSDFRNIVTVHSHKYNMGGDINIALSFQLAETEWMWLLSDDDITEPNSISQIIGDINSNNEVCWIKYSIAGEYIPYDDLRIYKPVDFFNYFSSNGFGMGQMIFMSNNVYHIDKIRTYIGEAPKYADTCMSQLIPPLLTMKNSQVPMLLSSKSICNYVGGKISYALLFAVIRVKNLLYYDFKPNDEEVTAIKSLKYTSPRMCIGLLSSIATRKRRYMIFKKLFVDYFSFTSLRGWVFIIYYLLYFKLCIRFFIK